ncbi:MAG: hypothetical protein A2511_01500 [Deltaproteobacteria bacterium RIFOXYD12_FULL_50_9]|nr:MAG: hypothetical protein A2511_01500 [Deltaproteobacteria bacterium RIFOXYD12_FULL_50_9]
MPVFGGQAVYKVVKGDTIEGIGAQLGVNWTRIVKDNHIDIKKILRIGQELRVNTRRIVPKSINNGIIINIPDRMLYFFKDGRLDMAFPVGLGKSSWMTPEGPFIITFKQKNPTWHVPVSIQQEMEMKGKPVKTIVVLPGPDNPLGRYVVKTSIRNIEIHETIWPTSVYQFRSHGCIRVLPQNIEKFYEEVKMNTPGELIYMPVKVARLESGRIFLEVHKDIYSKIPDLRDETNRHIEKAGLAGKVDWQKVETMLKEKTGIAEDVTL